MSAGGPGNGLTLANDLRRMARPALMMVRPGHEAPARAGFRSQHA